MLPQIQASFQFWLMINGHALVAESPLAYITFISNLPLSLREIGVHKLYLRETAQPLCRAAGPGLHALCERRSVCVKGPRLFLHLFTCG